MAALITVCARGGSKGIPGKNLRSLAGRPLIQHSIDVAHEVATHLDSAVVALSTDDDAIAAAAAEAGLTTDFRRAPALATDTAGKIPVLRDLLEHEEAVGQTRFDLLIDLDVSSPMRTVEDVLAGYERLTAHPDALNLFSVSPARKNPYFNMVEPGDGPYVRLVKDPAHATMSRQAAPPVYEMNASFYLYRRAFFDAGESSAVTARSLTHVMDHVCFDLDEQADFDHLEHLVASGGFAFR